MKDWTLAHPYLTFLTMLFFGMVVNNIVVNLINKNKPKADAHKKPSLIVESGSSDQN